jgi:hypothetical protein
VAAFVSLTWEIRASGEAQRSDGAWVSKKALVQQSALEVSVHPARSHYPVRSPSDFGLKLLPGWDPLRGDPRLGKIVASVATK